MFPEKKLTMNAPLTPILTIVFKNDFFELLFYEKGRFKPGHSYLIEGRTTFGAFHYSAEVVNQYYERSHIKRQHPDLLDASKPKTRSRVIWLSTTLGKDCMDPHSIEISPA